MSGDLKILERHFRHWRERELVTPEHEVRLREASRELEHGNTGTVVRAALGALGGGLLLAGLVLIVAENWGAIPRFAKLGAWAALQVSFLYLAHVLGERFPERPYLGEALAGVAGGWVLAGIALVSQIYHLQSRPPNGVWLWLALLLPAAWILRQRATAAVVFTAIASGLALEVSTKDSFLYAEHADGLWLFVAIPVLAAALVSWLPHPAGFIRGLTGAWVFFVSNLFLLVLGAEQEFHRTSLGGAWLLALAGIGLAMAQPQRVLPVSWDGLTARLLIALPLLPWVLIGSQYDGDRLVDLSAVGLSWILQLAIAVLVIRSGVGRGSPTAVNLGYLALLIGILTRYFDFFGSYLEGGAALAATGVLLLFILYALERSRRRTLAQEVAV